MSDHNGKNDVKNGVKSGAKNDTNNPQHAAFSTRVDYVKLPQSKLIDLFEQAITAHRNFFLLWQAAVSDACGRDAWEEMSQQVYNNFDVQSDSSDPSVLRPLFFEEMNFLWSIMPDMAHMLTFADYDASLLPPQLDETLDLNALSQASLLLLWNLSTLTYVMQTDRWTNTLTRRYDQGLALKLEKEIWVDRGGAEEDLRYGLQAAGKETGDVETLLRGFQMAPGEVGLVDAEFTLESKDHGWITHRRCPAHELMRDSNKERLENSCVICVIAMRLSGEMVNKDIRCRAASLPPHKTEQDHACRWEYWVESKS